MTASADEIIESIFERAEVDARTAPVLGPLRLIYDRGEWKTGVLTKLVDDLTATAEPES